MLVLRPNLSPRQVADESMQVLTDVLLDEVNLAVWRRSLPASVADFAEQMLARQESLAQSMTLELAGADAEPNLHGLAEGFAGLDGYAEFIADVAWLVRAYTCLLDAKRIGLRLRVLDKAMCPRFHVDNVPLRLITTYAGSGSQWLKEGAIERHRLGDPLAEPQETICIQQVGRGQVALLKGEKWVGNEGHGLIHRSPPLAGGERRLLLTLDWLA